MGFITDTGDAGPLIKALADSIPEGEHPNPHNEFIQVRLDIVEEAIDHFEWLEKGIEEWRELWAGAARKNSADEAKLRIAIGHLHAVLNKARTFDEQQKADTAARDWLVSIGSEPS